MDEKLPKARCGECPLREYQCVAPSLRHAAHFAIVGEGPGRQEVDEGRPFIGPSGRLLRGSLQKAGVDPDRAIITNATACFPGRKLTPKEWVKAVACCQPRLEEELAEVPKSVSFGAKALLALTGKTGKTKMTAPSIMAWFGHPLTTLSLNSTFPCFHPALALRQPSLINVFQNIMKRAGRWLNGQTAEHRWAQTITEPGAEAEALLAQIRASGRFGFDVETAGTDPFSSKLLVVGVGNHKVGGVSLLWPIEHLGTRQALLGLLSSACVKVAHNAAHDVLTLCSASVTVAEPIHDTLLKHTAVFPQLPHNLGFCCAQLFDAPRWKADFHDEGDMKGVEAFTHADSYSLRVYNARDCMMAERLDAGLEKLMEPRDANLNKRSVE